MNNASTGYRRCRQPTVGRRDLLRCAVAGAAVLLAGRPVRSDAAPATLAALEAASGGRLGVAVLDTAVGDLTGHRIDSRFALCSTFKLALAGLVLREADAGRLSLDQEVRYSEADRVPYAPVTDQYIERGFMTVAGLAEAAQVTSDNVAANLLLRLLDGPAGFTQRLRDIGDAVTRIDRYEPELNLVPEGETRDTTTPAAMAATVGRFVTPGLLSDESRQTLVQWMIATQTGLNRLRGGLPDDWVAGDKTGTGVAAGMHNKVNDIAAIWPNPGRSPFIVTAYFEADGEYESTRPQDVEVLESTGRIAAEIISGRPAP